ncbi:MAG: RNA polymerase sigma factor [Deltaproteobacteria bacterium]|jgi:RNA polymerase sigma-70 factor, ECF subfamily|nr:RNA polymerase sigma factor [Deltaproteobacteria bacterium]MBT4526085.1 RNA polymerase sigma factor [Deltaproteobacteria bacterium]
MNNFSNSDAELIQATIDNDQESFKIFVERYQKPIFSYLYRFLYQNREAAEDITQSVFLKVYQNLNNIDTSKSIKSWIYRIAHNEAANYLRSVSSKKESIFDDEQWSKMADQKEPEEDISKQYTDIVQTALKKLKPKYREVIVLFYFEEKSYDEIATILDSSTNSVGTQIRRAKHQLKKILDSLAPDLAAIFIVLLSLLSIKRGRTL